MNLLRLRAPGGTWGPKFRRDGRPETKKPPGEGRLGGKWNVQSFRRRKSTAMAPSPPRMIADGSGTMETMVRLNGCKAVMFGAAVGGLASVTSMGRDEPT